MLRKVTAIYDSGKAVFDKDKKTFGKVEDETLIKDGYAELLGITDPQLSSEACFGCESGKKEDSVAPIIYQYFWSLGLCGSTDEWYKKLDGDDPIVVQFILHTMNSAFSIHPVGATLRQMSPYEKTKGGEIVDFFKMLTPILSTTGKVLDAAGVPVAGKVVSAISGMQLNNIPVSDFPWYVKTFSYRKEPGVEWHIPQNLVHLTGNFLEGSLGVYFIKCSDNSDDLNKALSIELRAFLRTKTQELFVTCADFSQPTQLEIKPKLTELTK